MAMARRGARETHEAPGGVPGSVRSGQAKARQGGHGRWRGDRTVHPPRGVKCEGSEGTALGAREGAGIRVRRQGRRLRRAGCRQA